MRKRLFFILVPLLLTACGRGGNVWINDPAAPLNGAEKVVVGKFDVQLIETPLFGSEPLVKPAYGVCFQSIEHPITSPEGVICGSIRNWAWNIEYPATSRDDYMFTTLKPGTYRISRFWFNGLISLYPQEIRFQVPETGDGVSVGTLQLVFDWRKAARNEVGAVVLHASSSGDAIDLLKQQKPGLTLSNEQMDTSRAGTFQLNQQVIRVY